MTTARGSLPRWVDVALLPILNVTLAFLIGGVVVMLVGQNPLQAVSIMISGSFGYGTGLGYTLYYTTTFIFAGLAVSIAYHAGLFNIGVEGQGYLGGLGLILLALPMSGLHWTLTVPVMIFSSAAFGAAWAFIPGVLQAKRGSHVVITTILFNFIATLLVGYILARFLKPAGVNSDESAPLARLSRVPQFSEFTSYFQYSPVNFSLFLAILALVGVYILIWRTKFGYAMRALGQNPTAARYAGISSARMIMIVMAISGAIAGLMAVNIVGGQAGRLLRSFTEGAGFVGVAVAFMGRAHPVGVALSSLLFGVLYQGGNELQMSMPAITRDMIVTIQALVILFTGAMGDMLRRPLEYLFARRAGGSG